MVAVAHSVLAIAYHLLKTGRPYAELGADYFDQLDAARAATSSASTPRAAG